MSILFPFELMLVGDFKMNYLEIIKLIAETITAISAAIVVLIHLFKIIPKSIKLFFSKTIPLFIKGTKNIDGKYVRGFKAIHVHKSNQETMQQIIQAISPEYETEEILVLNKTAQVKTSNAWACHHICSFYFSEFCFCQY